MTEEEFLSLLDGQSQSPAPASDSGFMNRLFADIGSSPTFSTARDLFPGASAALDFYGSGGVSEIGRQAFNPTESETDRNRGLVRSLLQTLPFVGGFADEGEAKLRALPAYLTDEDYSDRYEDELGTVRGYLDAAQEQAPGAAFAAELATGMTPFGVGKTVLSKLGLSALEGAAQGYGRGETAKERTDAALKTGLMSAGLSGILQGFGKGGRTISDYIDSKINPSEMKSIGLRGTDLSKSARDNATRIKGGFVDEIPIQKAARNAKDADIIRPGQDSFERIGILNEKKDEVFSVIDEVTKKADNAAKAMPVRIDIENDFPATMKLMEGVNPGTPEYSALQKAIYEQTSAIGSQIERKGTLAEILRQKRLSYGKQYDVFGTLSARGGDLEKSLALDLKNLAKDRISQLADAGIIDKQSRTVFDAANVTYGELETLQNAYVRNVSKGLSADVFQDLISNIRTSGGLGSIMNASANFDKPVLTSVIPFVGQSLQTERGQGAIASLLKGVSPVAGATADVLSTAEKRLRPATVAANVQEEAMEQERQERGATDAKLSESDFLRLFDSHYSKSNKQPSKAEKKTVAPIEQREEPTMPVSESLRKAVISVESSGNPKAVSSAGAQGLMQVMPATAKEVLAELGRDPAEYDPFNAEQNVEVGTRYLENMIEMFGGDIELALAAYNGGPGRVRRLLRETGGTSFADIISRLPKETREYVPKVLGRLERV